MKKYCARQYKGREHPMEYSNRVLLRINLKILFLLTVLISCSLMTGSAFSQSDGKLLPPEADKLIPALNFKNTDIRDVLRAIALEYKTNIAIDNDIDSKISVALFNVTVANAIKLIAEDNGYNYSYDKQRFFVRARKVIAPPLPPEPEPSLNYSNGKISIEANNVRLQNLIAKLRTITKRNYLITPGTTGRITGSLDNIGLTVALRNILQNNGFYLTTKDSIFYISRSAHFSSIRNNSPLSSNPYWVSANNNRVSLDVTNADIKNIISDLSNQLNMQIIQLAVPEGKATIKCNDISIQTALGYLLMGTNYTFKQEGGAYIIGNKSSKDLANTRLIKLNYLRADKLKENIPASIKQDLTVEVSIEHNGLVITGENGKVTNLVDYIKKIDQPVPQVLIEALVVDYNLDNSLQLGLNAGTGDSVAASRPDHWYPGLDVTASGNKINKILKDIGKVSLFGHDFDIGKLGKLPSNFYANIKALEQQGIANVKSKPILSTLNGHTASLKIGTIQNYVFDEILPITSAVNSTFIQKETIQKIEASISFKITPWVGPNNELTLDIKPDFQTPVGPFSPDKKLIPAINTRSLESTVRLRNGETIVLGGLIQESETRTENKIPLLGDIPILGNLFKSVDKKKSKGELIIYLTPKISYGDDFGSLYFDYASK